MNEIISFVNSRLDQMFKTPKMFAACLESLELQFILLMEVKDLAEKQIAPKDTLREYQRFLRQKFPDSGPLYAWSILSKDDYTGLVEVMKEFRESHS